MVDKIKQLCKKKGISLFALEKELGFGNGTIGKWGKNGRQPSMGRVIMVADYFGVPVSELTGEQKENPSAQTSEGKIPKYDKLNAANKAIVDSVIAQLLAGQSDD